MSEEEAKPLYALTVAEYVNLNRKLFTEIIQHLLSNQVNSQTPKEENDILFMPEVMRLTGYQKATIYSKISRFEMPVLSRKKPLTFSRKGILEWINNGKPNLIDQEAEEFLSSKKRLQKY